MEKLGLLLLTLVALLHLKTSLAGGVAQGDIGTFGFLCIFTRKVHVWGSFWLKFFSDSGRPRPGECPRELRVAPSKMGCKCDEDCPRGHKCCKFKCGTACIPPILSRSGFHSQPLSCHQTFWKCSRLCVHVPPHSRVSLE